MVKNLYGLLFIHFLYVQNAFNSFTIGQFQKIAIPNHWRFHILPALIEDKQNTKETCARIFQNHLINKIPTVLGGKPPSPRINDEFGLNPICAIFSIIEIGGEGL